VIYAKQTLGASDSGYGLLLGSWGVGMVIGSLIFARARRARLAYLLFFSTATVGAGYLGLAAAPTLAVACAASVVGGAGNGVQWVAAVSAVQELTREDMQARVMSVLESVGAAMPGVGYLLGGLITVAANPRTTFLVAGLGVMAVVVMATLLLGPGWNEETGEAGDDRLDANNGVVLELLPGSSPSNATRRS
jgi:MFS family permease